MPTVADLMKKIHPTEAERDVVIALEEFARWAVKHRAVLAEGRQHGLLVGLSEPAAIALDDELTHCGSAELAREVGSLFVRLPA